MIHGYNEEFLTREWLCMTNDDFYKKYGFNWIPPIKLRMKIQKQTYESGNFNRPFLKDFRG